MGQKINRGEVSDFGDEAKMETKRSWEKALGRGYQGIQEEESREFQEGGRREHCAKERLSTMRNEKN